ncbi:transposase [Streptomyces sp. NPDC051366]|uniref:transposase n=1 Tax=Streptomyces sp. NPDC051366 TaxID=3365652 RepID=UPI0037B53C56
MHASTRKQDYLARNVLRIALTVVKRSDDVSGFVVLPKRWLVERTFAWLMRSRRLARDYERRTDTAEAMIRWSMSMVMSRRLARRRTEHPRAFLRHKAMSGFRQRRYEPALVARVPPQGAPAL